MYQFTVPMAIIDFIPVILFGIAAVLLQQDLYNKMIKGSFAYFAAGTINVFAAGFLKALWKLLYAMGICDFHSLNTLFLPLQSIGFLLAGWGIALMFTKKHRALLTVAPPLYSGVMVYISMMVLGLGSVCTCLAILAGKMKKKLPVLFFILSFLCSMGMGAMAGKDSTNAAVNWIEQAINCTGQGLFLAGTLVLHKNGLRDFQL